uniref:Large ribosomal subunit protein uL29m n=1 Tax=Nelumbo nucifera TaxID=4432 RepID=A0A822Y123_NELNU|nr:TPA_asm: hypothetical protein HUJ06_029082 [Nelumbo nucifera]
MASGQSECSLRVAGGFNLKRCSCNRRSVRKRMLNLRPGTNAQTSNPFTVPNGPDLSLPLYFLFCLRSDHSTHLLNKRLAIPRRNLVITMFMTRVFGRTLFAAAKSEASAATAAAAASARMVHNPLQEFFEADRSQDDDQPVVYGRSWKASELRLKSWDDLHKLWYVLLKEKNMLMTQRQMLHAQNLTVS